MSLFERVWKVLFTATFVWSLMCCTAGEDNQGTTVGFPDVTEARPITGGPNEHLYASYYGINSFSANERYATVLETDVRHRLPTEHDPATLGLVDLTTRELRPIAQTRAWNFQQGCMAHWLGTSPDSLIIYNDLRQGKFVSVIRNVFTEEARIIPHPVSAVSPDGTQAISINFARLRETRTDYGYGGAGQDAQTDVPFPDNDGLFLIDLQSGEAELIFAISDVRDYVPQLPPEGREYFNHTLFSRDGSKVFFLARAIPERNTVAFTINSDCSDLQPCFPGNTEWGGSHFDWLSGDDLMVTARYRNEIYTHVLFTVGQQNYQLLGNGLLDFDGHGTFSPDGRWMVTHTYPDQLDDNKIFLMDMRTQVVLPLGRFREPPEFRGYWRCDIHPRWSPGGKYIGFNSTHTGSRQAYVFELQ